MKKFLDRDCFIHNGSYFAARIQVYEGGVITYWGRHTKEEFLADLEKGWITVDIPDGEELRICNQDLVVIQGKTNYQDGRLMFVHKWITKESFKMEVLDAIDRSLGNESAASICYKAFEKYQAEPTDENLKRLRIAYGNVPQHKRLYILGDQDLKDGPIRGVLGI